MSPDLGARRTICAARQAFALGELGMIIALLGCHFGMRTRGGSVGVGRSTSRTVVAISITLLIADFFLTKLVFAFWNVIS